MMASRRSFNGFGHTQLEALWKAVHHQPVPRKVGRVFDLFVPPDSGSNTWPSQISDDQSPYEFSLLLGGPKPSVRLMAEAIPQQRKDVTLADTIVAGRALARQLADEFGTDVSRLDKVADLFLPDDARGAFALWFGAEFSVAGEPEFKVYLNPYVRGAIEAPRLVEEMLTRLGFAGAWATLSRTLSRGFERDELRFVSLDLGSQERARAKVYAFHHDASVEYLAKTAGIAPGADEKRLTAFCRTVAGGDGVLRAPRQPGTCFAFVGGEALPRTCTLHVPIRSFADSDATAHARTLQALADVGIQTAPYESAVEALSQRPLESGSGFVAWVALRTGGPNAKVNVYLAPKAVTDEVSHPLVTPVPDPEAPETVVREQEQDSFVNHPLMQRILREPFDLATLTLVLLNVREAVARHFTRRLASVISRMEEEDIRSILAKQLNDELGNGDPERTHRKLFDVFVAGLEPWAPVNVTDELLEPGRTLSAIQEDLYVRRSPYEGLGATLAMEIGGKQFDIFMGQQFRRKREALPATVLEWLTLHEELEVEHVNESFDLAQRVPRGTKARQTARGAREVREAGWAFFDSLYRLCYR